MLYSTVKEGGIVRVFQECALVGRIIIKSLFAYTCIMYMKEYSEPEWNTCSIHRVSADRAAQGADLINPLCSLHRSEGLYTWVRRKGYMRASLY